MPVSHRYQCIFVHIPKCSGTSVEAALGMHGNLNFVGVRPYLNQTVNESTLFGKSTQHLTAVELETRLGADIFNKYFKFAIVRNPWDRFISYVSWRSDKNGNRKWSEKLPLCQYDVDEAICELLRSDTDSHNPHLRHQYKYIYDDQCKSKVDFIGKFECISNDWKYICDTLCITCSLPIRMQSCHDHYSTYLSDDQVNILSDYYEKDIKIFDYAFERML